MQIKETQIIISAKLARHLLKMGFLIVDIKQNNRNPNRTVFFFKNSDALQREISFYKKMNKN